MQSTRNLTKGMPARIFILVAGIIPFLIACGGEKKPKTVIAESEFSALLVDVYLAEAKLANVRVSQDSAMRLFEPFEEQLLKKKNISRTALKETYRYYIEHPGEFEKVYEKVMDTLSLREQRALAAKKVADSVSNAKRMPVVPEAKKSKPVSPRSVSNFSKAKALKAAKNKPGQ